MNLTRKQKNMLEQVINVFETGSPVGNYGAIALLNDGPGGEKQISYGRSQTTESGQLKDLINDYIEAKGRFKDNFIPYVNQIKSVRLSNDKDFIALLKAAGTDQIMKDTQDKFFDKRFFQPAMKWADDHGFTLPLSALVIYDSFIHSGSILRLLRNRFVEPVPAKGGNETVWVEDYCRVRKNWLTFHSNEILHNTAYRSEVFLKEMIFENWNLAQPIKVRGFTITG